MYRLERIFSVCFVLLFGLAYCLPLLDRVLSDTYGHTFDPLTSSHLPTSLIGTMAKLETIVNLTSAIFHL